MHEYEIPLIFKTPSGKILPTKEFDSLAKEATALSPNHVEALSLQVNRQVSAL